MSNSLRDQLLQAGLVTEEQVKKAEQKKKTKPKSKPIHKNTNKLKSKPKQQPQKKKPHSKQSDLAKFYQQRTTQERNEKKTAEKEKQEAAQLKKERNKRARQLINKHKLDDATADIRYNFVVGKTIKYIFVTKEQQQLLEKEKLAITLHAGNRYLIPNEIGKELQKIDPNKIIIF